MTFVPALANTLTTRQGTGSLHGDGCDTLIPVHAAALTPSMQRYDPGTETLIPFDTTQITSATNRSQPRAGDPCHPLAAGAHPPAIAFSGKDHGADATEELAPTLRAMEHCDGNPNGGGQLSVAHGLNWQRANSNRELAPTLTTGGILGVGISAATEYGVRRLLPVECERLQGYPDGWTDVPDAKGRGAADGPRYRGLGNSVAIPVVEWIMRHLAARLAFEGRA